MGQAKAILLPVNVRSREGVVVLSGTLSGHRRGSNSSVILSNGMVDLERSQRRVVAVKLRGVDLKPSR